MILSKQEKQDIALSRCNVYRLECNGETCRNLELAHDGSRYNDLREKFEENVKASILKALEITGLTENDLGYIFDLGEFE